ncbi:MAG: uroporphyrinogen-III synthase [Proteobacteria bacterium]|nr:uroporphyrinogen-III synthase [Pseudomonadota bacterium]
MDESCLKGVTAVWIGSYSAAHALLGAIEQAGASVERLPLIKFGPPTDAENVRQIFRDLDRFSWVLFTSAQAALGVAGLPRPKARIAAVGPSTAAKLKDQGWSVDLVPLQHNAQGLAQALERETVPSRPVLFVRGDRAMRTLPERLTVSGFTVEEVEVYSTLPVDFEDAVHVAKQIADIADIVIASSPFGVRTLADTVAPRSLGDIRPGLKWVCLGLSTREALEAAGVKDAVFPGKVAPSQFVESVINIVKKMHY